MPVPAVALILNQGGHTDRVSPKGEKGAMKTLMGAIAVVTFRVGGGGGWRKKGLARGKKKVTGKTVSKKRKNGLPHQWCQKRREKGRKNRKRNIGAGETLEALAGKRGKGLLRIKSSMPLRKAKKHLEIDPCGLSFKRRSRKSLRKRSGGVGPDAAGRKGKAARVWKWREASEVRRKKGNQLRVRMIHESMNRETRF